MTPKQPFEFIYDPEIAQAVLIAAAEDGELERLVLAHTPRFRRLLDAAEQRIQEGKGVKHEDFWRAVDATA